MSMRKLFYLIVVVGIIALGSNAIAAPSDDLRFFGNKVDRGLQVKNVGNQTIHAFILIDAMGCNGSMVPTGNGKYKLEKGQGKDYFTTASGETAFADSYFWKLSHYNLYVLQPGQKASVQNAPCFGDVTYHKIGRAWVFNDSQWNWIKANCLRVNPNCQWAK